MSAPLSGRISVASTESVLTVYLLLSMLSYYPRAMEYGPDGLWYRSCTLMFEKITCRSAACKSCSTDQRCPPSGTRRGNGGGGGGAGGIVRKVLRRCMLALALSRAPRPAAPLAGTRYAGMIQHLFFPGSRKNGILRLPVFFLTSP